MSFPSQSSENENFHKHCLYGCEKAVGEIQEDGTIICVRCGGPWVECTPEICDI